MKLISLILPFSVLLLGVAASCEVGPNYKRPPQHMPTTFKSATTAPATTQLASDWWKMFGDHELDQLETDAIAENTDIKVAIERVDAARAAARATSSQFYPTLQFDPSITRQRTVSSFVSSGGGGAGGVVVGTGNSSNSNARTFTTVLLPLDLNYEVDIWGKIRRAYEASKAQFVAAAYDCEVVRQTVESDLAQDYFNLRSLDDQDKILLATVESYRTEVKLTQTELNAKLVSAIDYVQAKSQLDATVAQELDVKRQRTDQEHAIAILLGQTPSELDLVTHPLDLMPPPVPVGLPSELLRRRPDVAEAEQNLVAANAQIGVAQAAYFPSLNLAAMAGFESSNLASALNWPNRVWSVGGSSALPLFEGGLLDANVEQAKANYRAQVATYRGTVLGAIRDVEDSLNDLRVRAQESTAQTSAVASSREYLRLSQIQYHQGLTSYLTVIDAERTLLSNELTNAQLLNEQLASTVLLIKALGGGWDSQNYNPPGQ